MSRVFIPQKHQQPVVAQKQVQLTHQKRREIAPCGASIKVGNLFAHKKQCPQCKLLEDSKKSGAV